MSVNLKLKDAIPKPMASDMASVRRRAAMVGIALLLALFGLGYRAWTVSVKEHSYWAERGNRQQIGLFRLHAGRGEIVDRNYLSLAVNDRGYKIVLNPRLIRATEGERQRVMAHLLEMFPDADTAYLDEELSKDKAYRMLRFSLDDQQAKTVESWASPGITLEQVPDRVYPRQLLAAHVLGRVNNQNSGNLGVELSMDHVLAGRDTVSLAHVASHQKKLLVDGHPDAGSSRGNNVVLTLDSAIQAMAEEEINTLVENWHPVGASIVVLDPKSGEILALTNRPSFDPNHRIDAASKTANLAVQAAYEPGSTAKAITVAAAIEEGTIRKNQTFFCEEGRWQYTPDHAIRDTKASEWLDVTEILATSSNICTTKIADTLGKQSLHRWVRKFHFGERPDVKLPGATKGLVADWEDWSDIQAANVSFGQGMSASPLQVASAFATLANGGVYNSPTMVKRVIATDGSVVLEHEPSGERLLRRSTARTVLDMLTAVVHTKKGTGKNAVIEGYTVAGKTSTAQKADHKNGGYFEDQYYASFVGAVPAADPRVVILVSVDNPEGGYYGNQVAAPTFSRLGARVMTYLGVPRNDGSVPVPDEIKLESDDPRLVEGFIDDLDIEPALPGQRKVTFTTGVPDFTGLTIAQAYDAAEAAHLEFKALGSGLAVGQDLPPGPADSESKVTVVFSPTE